MNGPSTQWLTFGHDMERSGDAPSQPPVSTVTGAWRAEVGGEVYAEPLVDGGRVIVATERDTVVALSTATGAVEWSSQLGNPVPGSSLPCGNIDPSGITGTPVIDPSTGTVWVVTFTLPGVHQLVGLDIASGRVTSRRTIVLPDVDPLAEQQRGALALTSGSVFVPFGGLDGDCGAYRGMVVAFSTSPSGAQDTFVVPARREGAIWAPPGPVMDSLGDLLVATGNGSSRTSFDEGDSVIALSPALRQVGVFAPADWARLNEDDLDLGSTSPALVGRSQVVQVGKSGVAYTLQAGHLGGIGGEEHALPVCSGEAVGATATLGDSVFVPCRSGLTSLVVGVSGRMRVAWTDPSITTTAPVVAANRVWCVTTSGRFAEVNEATGHVLLERAVAKGTTSFPPLAVAAGMAFVPSGTSITGIRGL